VVDALLQPVLSDACASALLFGLLQRAKTGTLYCMKSNQLTRGLKRRVMYVENKNGDIDGAAARIGWVTFSQSDLSVYYRGRTLVKKNGSNRHWASRMKVRVDEDAQAEYDRIRRGDEKAS